MKEIISYQMKTYVMEARDVQLTPRLILNLLKESLIILQQERKGTLVVEVSEKCIKL
jgi:hypothetical protein